MREEQGEHQVHARGRWIPLLQLHEVLGGDQPLPLARWAAPEDSQPDAMDRGADPATPVRQPVIVLAYGDLQFGVTCTRVVGPREIVLKQLGPVLAGLPLFSGATISGSSKVQFVLDAAMLARLARGSSSPVAIHAPEPTRTTRVLLVDDSRSVRAALSHILHIAGYSVDVAADGWEAWERLQVRGYDLLLTDLEMPRLHGYELIARCRRSQALAELPILVLTSRTAEQNRQIALRKGANGFLAKPINRRLILEAIHQLVGGP
jgi:chemosensory pili system protein ChpA (sensor histidine kinase/response regulator)